MGKEARETPDVDAPASEDEGRRPAKVRGRKRDTDRTAAIVQAAGELLLEVGFDKLRVQDVAKRAGAGTGAIYRRWSTKEALFADAIRAMPPSDPKVTDDALEDLKTLVGKRCRSMSEKPDLVPGLIVAMRADAGIEDAVKAGYDVTYIRNIVGRVIGEDHEHLEVLVELTQAIPLFRNLFPPNAPDADETTDAIVSLIQSFAKG